LVAGVGALTDKVLAVLGISKLLDELLDGVGRGTDEAETPEMAHSLSLEVIEAAEHIVSTAAHAAAGSTYSMRYTSWFSSADCVMAVDTIDTCDAQSASARPGPASESHCLTV
jgi:hypothetical protein